VKQSDEATCETPTLQLQLSNYIKAGHDSHTVFARSEAATVGSNPTQGMDVWCVCAIFCVRVQATS
jgi:hypothetical protein